MFRYDDHADVVSECRKWLLADISRLEVGSESKSSSIASSPGASMFFKSPKKEAGLAPLNVMRFHSATEETLQFRSTKLRFFNNMAVPICKTEDMNESLKAIAETVHVTMEMSGISISYHIGLLEKLAKTSSSAKPRHLDVPLFNRFPRNASEGQLSAIKQAGSKALSSVTSHFARLKGPAVVSPVQSLTVTNSKENLTPHCAAPTSQGLLNSGSECDLESSSFSSFEDGPTCAGDQLYSRAAGILFYANRERLTKIKNKYSVQPIGMTAPRLTTDRQSKKILSRCVSAGNFDVNSRTKRNPAENTLISMNEHLYGPVTVVIDSIDGIAGAGKETAAVTNNMLRLKYLSHSSEYVEPAPDDGKLKIGEPVLFRASSEKSLPSPKIGLKNSVDDPVIMSGAGSLFLASLKSPSHLFNSASGTNPGVSGNPLSFLARGVHNFGANLDPRKKEFHQKTQTTRTTENASHKPCLTRIIHV